MSRPMTALLSALVLAGSLGGLLAAGIEAGSAAGTIETIVGPGGSGPAATLAVAERISGLTDVVTIYNRANALAPAVETMATAAADGAGAAWALSRGATVGLRAVRRGAATVKEAPTSFQFPMAVTALPTNAVGPIFGTDLSAVLATGRIVMSTKSAALNSAQAGDVVDLIADDGSIKSYIIGMVADDAIVGGTELLITPAIADELGVLIETRIVLWGFPSRGAIDASLAAQGLPSRSDTRIRKSWDPIDPFGILGLVSVKELLGEFAYHVAANDSVSLTGDWVNTYLPPDREVLVPQIPIRARCNLRARADLVAALTEVYQSGLAGAIDVANANTYGGCFYPRFNRIGAALGSLSRHSWGAALDTNTVTNAQGATPQMNCGVVRIFRKHNFAWGGNFLTSDGMHFEWVGTRRDQYQYPSKYCPNLPIGAATETGTETNADARPDPAARPSSTAQPGRGTLFVEDGWGGE